MKNKIKRKKFEKAVWNDRARDGLPTNPLADPSCKSCRGHGIVDAGYFLCVLENCPDCYNK